MNKPFWTPSTIIIIVLLIVIGVYALYRWDKEFPMRYMQSDKFKNTLVCLTPYAENFQINVNSSGRNVFTFTITENDEQKCKELIDTIKSKFMHSRVKFVIKSNKVNYVLEN